jgi:hypothetical protein
VRAGSPSSLGCDQRFGWLKEYLRGLDPRSLACFRMLLAFAILRDIQWAWAARDVWIGAALLTTAATLWRGWVAAPSCSLSLTSTSTRRCRSTDRHGTRTARPSGSRSRTSPTPRPSEPGRWSSFPSRCFASRPARTGARARASGAVDHHRIRTTVPTRFTHRLADATSMMLIRPGYGRDLRITPAAAGPRRGPATAEPAQQRIASLNAAPGSRG